MLFLIMDHVNKRPFVFLHLIDKERNSKIAFLHLIDKEFLAHIGKERDFRIALITDFKTFITRIIYLE